MTGGAAAGAGLGEARAPLRRSHPPCQVACKAPLCYLELRFWKTEGQRSEHSISSGQELKAWPPVAERNTPWRRMAAAAGGGRREAKDNATAAGASRSHWIGRWAWRRRLGVAAGAVRSLSRHHKGVSCAA